jgi:hypothetical protein
MIQGRVRTCTVDESVDEFVNKSRTVLYWLVKTELMIDMKDFYAGHPDIAKRAQLTYRRFGD